MGKATKKEDSSDLEKYVGEMGRVKIYPQNEYEHADSLIRSDFEDEREAMDNFSKLVDKHLQLVNIGSDQMMRAYQTDAILLTHMVSMARREKALEKVFGVLYFGWRNELLLTKAMKGAERKHQAQVGSSYVPKEDLSGFGTQYPNQEEDEGGGNILSKIFGKRKKRRDW